MLVDGPIGRRRLPCHDVTQVLVPELRPGDIAVMDNLPSHKVSGVKQGSRRPAQPCSICRPYSPDFNPIEMAFSKLKAILRQAAGANRRRPLGRHRPISRRSGTLPQANAETISPPQDMNRSKLNPL